MALHNLPSATIEGISCQLVTVEVDVSSGLPGFTIVGLADKAIEESRERVRNAIKHSGYSFPLARITVHLAPSETKKTGIHFDLPIAIAILMADGQLKPTVDITKTLFIGGLRLDGQLQPISGTVSLVEWAKLHGYKQAVLPSSNVAEAQLIEDIELIPVTSLKNVIDFLYQDYLPVSVDTITRTRKAENSIDNDWLQIQGQQQAKRAALIAAAGAHNLLLEGPPGAGKTLLARGIRALLPSLERNELIEVIKLQSIAGQLPADQLLNQLPRPFRSPHHSASHIAIIGGGTHPRPGEISLAHRGVLFLDELPEFARQVVESLRQPLEDRVVHIARAHQAVTFPAQFMLVATMNPCPCGWLGSKQKECSCTPMQISQYRKKISGPILDRIDLYLQLPPVSFAELRSQTADRQQLEEYRQKVVAARGKQLARNAGELNVELSSAQVNKHCQLDSAAESLLEKAATQFSLTGRSIHKLMKVARTIADLAGKETIGTAEMSEALFYRSTLET